MAFALVLLLCAPAGHAQDGAPAAGAATVPSGAAAPPVAAYGIRAHALNYLLLYSRLHETPRLGRDREEAVFQISLKRDVLDAHVGCGAGCLWVLDAPLYLAYTQRSFWQVYDTGRSRPFRETLYNPELFLDYGESWLAGSRFGLRLGIEHLSNGRSQPDSRSWNRTYVQGGYTGAWGSLALKLWTRIPEEAKSGPDDPTGDDNPDITDYLGYGQAEAGLRFGDGHELRLMLRPGGHRDTLTGRLELLYHPSRYQPGIYVLLQVFNGYGENLIDYDRRVRRVGLGIAFR